MNEDYVVVPLQDGEQSLPFATLRLPQITFANGTYVQPDFATVRLNDESAYERVPMRSVDQESIPKLGF